MLVIAERIDTPGAAISGLIFSSQLERFAREQTASVADHLTHEPVANVESGLAN